MTLTSLALLAQPASANDIIGVEVDAPHHHVSHDEPAHDEPPPQADVSRQQRHRDAVWLDYGMQFTPEAPAHHLSGKITGPRDAYLHAELRYLPLSDVLWTGRAGAGIDVLGGGNWDVTLGLWLGTAGEWDRGADRAILYAAPMAGTEVSVAVDFKRLFASYRWLAGIGAGPIDDLLTEQELTVGYKLTRRVHAYGQWFALSPGELDNRSGIGLGARLVL